MERCHVLTTTIVVTTISFLFTAPASRAQAHTKSVRSLQPVPHSNQEITRARTMMRYEQVVRDFLSTIGTQAQAPLEALSTDTILAFKERWLPGPVPTDREPDDKDLEAPV